MDKYFWLTMSCLSFMSSCWTALRQKGIKIISQLVIGMMLNRVFFCQHFGSTVWSCAHHASSAATFSLWKYESPPKLAVIVQITLLEFYRGGSDAVMSRLSSSCRIFLHPNFSHRRSTFGDWISLQPFCWRWRKHVKNVWSPNDPRLCEQAGDKTGRSLVLFYWQGSFWCRRPSLIKQDGYPCRILCCDWSVSYHHWRSGF